MKDGNQLIDEAAEHVTLDEVMRRDPRTVTDDEFEDMIRGLRRARAMFIKGSEDRRQKRKEKANDSD